MAIRIGSVLPDLIIPYTYTRTGSLVLSQTSGIVFASFGVLFSLLFNLIDSYNERMILKKKLNETSMMLGETRDGALAGKSTIVQMEEDEINIQSFMELDKGFWIFSVLIVCMYGTFQPFNANLNALIRERFGFDIVAAGQVVVRL